MNIREMGPSGIRSTTYVHQAINMVNCVSSPDNSVCACYLALLKAVHADIFGKETPSNNSFTAFYTCILHNTVFTALHSTRRET